MLVILAHVNIFNLPLHIASTAIYHFQYLYLCFEIYIQINQEREGDEIDQALVKNILEIYVEIGVDSMKNYIRDFEEAMLKDSAAFYSQKASNWIITLPYDEYMLKVILNTNSP